MTHRVGSSIGVALLVSFAFACGGALAGAKSDFKGGRVAEAKDKLVAMEADSRSWTGTRRAEYVLYRGLVHHALGDRAAAAPWLREAKALEDEHPRTLSEDDRARLDLALDALGSGASGPTPAPESGSSSAAP
ncbi:MAG: hypothetical protein KF764_11985 [Labilithrix sp.]|nr:hypothetical protein [Labilithrix sp.]